MCVIRPHPYEFMPTLIEFNKLYHPHSFLNSFTKYTFGFVMYCLTYHMAWFHPLSMDRYFIISLVTTIFSDVAIVCVSCHCRSQGRSHTIDTGFLQGHTHHNGRTLSTDIAAWWFNLVVTLYITNKANQSYDFSWKVIFSEESSEWSHHEID